MTKVLNRGVRYSLYLISIAFFVVISGCATTASGPVSDAAPPGTTWKWNYRTYDTLSHDEMPSGVLRLRKTTDGFEARIDIQMASECFKGSMAPAKVEIGPKTTTIVVPALMPGCGDRRYTLANDGSGGTMAIRSGAMTQRNGQAVPPTAWVDDVTPRGLTVIK